MTKQEARTIAKEMNDQQFRPGVTWKAAPQDWRDGGLWYVRGSDKSALFKG